MGKQSRKKAARAAGLAQDGHVETDDEILDKAVAENAAEAEQKMRNRVELLMSLDQHVLFNIYAVVDDKPEICTSQSGDIVFYFDEQDARAAMAERQLTHTSPIGLACTPLGRAFGMSENWIPAAVPPGMAPMRLQASTVELNDLAKQGVQARDLAPLTLRNRMNQRTSPLPVYSLEELQNETHEPYFFKREEAVAYWQKTAGKSVEGLAANLVITDLRVLIWRMLMKPLDRVRIQIMPTERSVGMLQSLQQAEVSAPAAAEPTKPAATVDDEPPPLEAS